MAFLTITFSSHRHFQCCMQWFVFQEENGCCKRKVSLINKLGKSYMKQVFVPFFNVGLVRASNTSTGRGEKKVNCVFQAKNHQHGKSRYEDIKSPQFTGLTCFRPMFHWGQLNLWMMLSILKILCFFSIALCSFDVRHHIHFFPTKRGIILIWGIFLIKFYQRVHMGTVAHEFCFIKSTILRNLDWKIPQPQKTGRCQEGRLKEDWSRSASVNRIKNFLLHARKYPTILIY